MSLRPHHYLIMITLIGALLRLAAFIFNDLPHGDINLDYAAAWNLSTNGRLMLPFVAPRPYPSAQLGFGFPYEQHPPLWPILGYLGATITGNIYLAFKLITLVSGILLIPLSYVAFRKAFGDLPALFSSVLIAFTYVLIDFSGNGSLYILHAFLILVFVFLAGKPERPLNAILLGIVAGLAYLLNYQAIVVLGALIVVYLYQFGYGKQLWKKCLMLSWCWDVL